MQKYENRYWSAELHRLRGAFLAVRGAEETQIEASFGEGIRIAREQKSASLEKRAEATYAEYRRQKASASGGSGFRLPLDSHLQRPDFRSTPPTAKSFAVLCRVAR